MSKNKLNGTSKPEKYAKAIVKGKSKQEAKEVAGYSKNTSSTLIEGTDTFKEAMDKYLMTLEDAFKEHRKNILQGGDKKAKNTALDMFYKLRSAYPKEAPILTGDFEIVVKPSKDNK